MTKFSSSGVRADADVRDLLRVPAVRLSSCSARKRELLLSELGHSSFNQIRLGGLLELRQQVQPREAVLPLGFAQPERSARSSRDGANRCKYIPLGYIADAGAGIYASSANTGQTQ